MNRLTHQNVAKMVRRVVNDLYSETEISSQKEMNEGYCGVVAGEVYTRLGKPDELQLCFAGEHANFHYWIEYNGRFYDAERPDGVETWKSLPFFSRHSDVSTYQYESWEKQGY